MDQYWNNRTLENNFWQNLNETEWHSALFSSNRLAKWTATEDNVSSQCNPLNNQVRFSSDEDIHSPMISHRVFDAGLQTPYGRGPPHPPRSISPPSSTSSASWGSVGSRSPGYEKPIIRRPSGFDTSTLLVKVRSCCDNSHNFKIVYECCNRELNSNNIEVVSHRQNPMPAVDLCRFCLRNGEPPSIVHSHRLRSQDGRITCPVLKQYNCPLCNNGGGDYAHTVRYCPTLRHVDNNSTNINNNSNININAKKTCNN